MAAVAILKNTQKGVSRSFIDRKKDKKWCVCANTEFYFPRTAWIIVKKKQFKTHAYKTAKIILLCHNVL